MDKYDVSGMSCAACSARVESAVKKVDGVLECSVNLLTNSMTVSGTALPENIILAVEKAGYGASLTGTKEQTQKNEAKTSIKPRLITSVILTLVLMYFSMGYTMFSFPVFKGIDNPISISLIQLLLSAFVMVINQKFFINGTKGILNKAPNMDTLVALGSGASFIYSAYSLFLMANDVLNASKYLHGLYFESAAMILTLITVGKLLEEYSKGKTTSAISSLMKLSPKTAIVLENNIEREVLIDNLKKGDLFVVKAGKSIPADGIVIKGDSAVDESALTGESIPVDKAVGDKVSAGTISFSGYMVCEATGIGEDTALSKIIEMVKNASSSKAPIARAANKISAVFVPFVLIIAFITTVIWIILGSPLGYSLARGVSVLVVSCPCALGLATPVAIMVGNGVGAKHGILFKTAQALEETGKVKTVVLDKTGTVTHGKPEISDIFSEDEKQLLTYAYSLEDKSSHPLAKAITDYAVNHSISKLETENFEIFSGNGLTGTINGEKVFGGNYNFAEKYLKVPEKYLSYAKKVSDDGKTPLFFGKNNEMLGVIEVSDKIKPTSKKAVSELNNMGIKVVMLTGDNKKTAISVAKEVGISDVVSDVLPEGKEKVIRELCENGKVMMVGDGINDAPSLTRADIGVAIGAGVDVAIDAADVVLVKNDLSDIVTAIKLSEKTLKNIYENLFWAFCYNIIGIPLAAGVFIKLLNWELNPMFGAAAMSVSSFFVVTNALRLNFFKINDKKENKKMTKTINIEGMMCPHCEARVEQKLMELNGVESVKASHEQKNATITLSKNIEDSVLVAIIENEGYKVIK